MTYSQTDLEILLQKLGCCIGRQAKKLANYYMYGSECKEEQLTKLTLLNAYADTLSCYEVQATTETTNVFHISFRDVKAPFIGDVFDFYLNGVNILSYTAVTNTLCTEIASMVTLLTALTTYIEVVTSTCSSPSAFINIQTSCENTPLFVTQTHVFSESTTLTYLPVIVFREGKCTSGDDDNCITEEQVNTIVENISKDCKECLKLAGFAYYNS